jgi:hypothetical protein
MPNVEFVFVVRLIVASTEDQFIVIGEMLFAHPSCPILGSDGGVGQNRGV